MKFVNRTGFQRVQCREKAKLDKDLEEKYGRLGENERTEYDRMGRGFSPRQPTFLDYRD